MSDARKSLRPCSRSEMERLAPLYRLAADAMEREIEIDQQLRESQ